MPVPDSPISRRRALRLLAGVAAGSAVAVLLPVHSAAGQPASARRAGAPRRRETAMTVYKSPTCGCCTAWIEHAEAAGFTCRAVDMPSLDEVKAAFGVPAALQSCHTVRVGRYFVEGHVPADLVHRLLAEAPADARGLAVPGMPVGSPGMEGGTPERYDVLLVLRDGGTRVYASR